MHSTCWALLAPSLHIRPWGLIYVSDRRSWLVAPPSQLQAKTWPARTPPSQHRRNTPSCLGNIPSPNTPTVYGSSESMSEDDGDSRSGEVANRTGASEDEVRHHFKRLETVGAVERLSVDRCRFLHPLMREWIRGGASDVMGIGDRGTRRVFPLDREPLPPPKSASSASSRRTPSLRAHPTPSWLGAPRRAAVMWAKCCERPAGAERATACGCPKYGRVH